MNRTRLVLTLMLLGACRQAPGPAASSPEVPPKGPAAPQPPGVELVSVTTKGVDPARPERARILISADRIDCRAARSTKLVQVATLKNFAGEPISWELLEATLTQKPPPDALEARVFDSAVDGWVELHIDRRAPMSLVVSVLKHVAAFGLPALAVKGTTGEHTIDLFPTGETTEDVVVQVAERLTVVVDGKLNVVPRSAESMSTQLRAFVDTHSKGRALFLPGLGSWQCPEQKGPGSCWHPRVLILPGDDVTWGDAAPIFDAAFEQVRDVQMGSM